MGASQSGEVSSSYLREFEKYYDFLKELNDPRFGLLRIYKKKNSDEEVMVVKKLYSSDEEYEYFQRELNIRLNFQHKGLLKLLGYQKESNSNLCGHSRVFELYSEFHAHNLKKEIQKRTASNDYFTEAELWYLAESCLAVGRFLQDRNIYHGDYRPINVMLSDEGYVKIPDNGVLSSVRNNYFKTLSGECRGYLTPELLRSLAKRDPQPRYNVFKADVFSLGMMFLSASTLVRPNTNCYEWSQYALNLRGIQDLLKQLEARYSASWKELVENMLGLGRDEESRFDFKMLYPLKINVPEPQPIVRTVEYTQPPPPVQKGSELILIDSQVLPPERKYETYQSGVKRYETSYEPKVQYVEKQYIEKPVAHVHYQQPPQVYPTSQVYTQTQPQQYVTYEEAPIIKQKPPQVISYSQAPVYSTPIEQVQTSAVYNSALYGSQVVPQQRIVDQQRILDQQSLVQHRIIEQPLVQQRIVEQPLVQQRIVEQPLVQQRIIEQPLVHQQRVVEQPVTYGSAVYQPGYTHQLLQSQPLIQQSQLYAQQPQTVQYQYTSNIGSGDGELQKNYAIGGNYQVSGQAFGETVGRQRLPIVQEERIERFEDNDLDRRVKEALRATQETIDRNTRMQSETQKYQYGNV